MSELPGLRNCKPDNIITLDLGWKLWRMKLVGLNLGIPLSSNAGVTPSHFAAAQHSFYDFIIEMSFGLVITWLKWFGSNPMIHIETTLEEGVGTVVLTWTHQGKCIASIDIIYSQVIVLTIWVTHGWIPSASTLNFYLWTVIVLVLMCDIVWILVFCDPGRIKETIKWWVYLAVVKSLKHTCRIPFVVETVFVLWGCQW